LESLEYPSSTSHSQKFGKPGKLDGGYSRLSNLLTMIVLDGGYSRLSNLLTMGVYLMEVIPDFPIF
jgi:hypothetical protein